MKKLITLCAMLIASVSFAQNWVDAMMDPNVNFYTVQDQFNDAWKGKEPEKGKGYKQFKRWEYFMEQRVAPTGVRPNPEVLFNTIQSAKTASNQSLGTWTAIGPFDGPNNFGIGRINTIEFDPTNSNIVWAGAPAGGLWKSTNGGVTWSTQTDELTNLGVSDVAINALDNNVMYLATGDRDGADTYSYGILKSKDGGNSWNPTGLSWNVSQSRRIGKIIVHPVDTNVVVAATRSGLEYSNNGGATFSRAQTGPFNTVVYAPSRPDTMFAGTLSNGNSRIYRSTDGGVTWTQLTSGLPTSGTIKRVEIAVSPQDPNYVYALYSNTSEGYYGLYQSTNGGNTWTQKSNSPNILGFSPNQSGGQSWYDLCLSVSPLNKNQIFVGSINLYRSNNGGTSWSYIGGYNNPRVHPDMHYMKFKPGTNTLFVGHDGGISYTSNAGTSYTHLIDGLNITQYYKMSTSQQSADIVIAGAQDNSTHLKKNSTWTVPWGGDGMDCAIDPLNDRYMFASSQYGNFARSVNFGQSFSYIGGLPRGSWVTPIEIDPTTPTNVYIGFDKLYKSTNRGATFTAYSTNNFGAVDDIAIAPSNGNIIYVAVNAAIYRSSNQGLNFTNITSGIGNSSYITDIAVSATNADHLWVVKSSYSNGNKVFESTDGGNTWSNVSGSLPNLPVNAIEYEAGSNDGVYVGTDVGVYYRDNDLNDWIEFDAGLPNVIVNDIEIYYAGKKLRIATYGRGMWESDLYSELIGPPVADFYASPEAVCSTQDTIQLIDDSDLLPTNYKWSISPSTYTFVNNTSSTSQNPYVVFNSVAEYTVSLEVENAQGKDKKTIINAISVGGKQLPFYEDFEANLSLEKWTIENTDNANGWNISTVHSGSPGLKVAKMNHFGYSAIGQKDALISPPINLSNKSSASLSFKHAYKRYSASRTDTLKVYISTDCGSTWTLLSTYAENGTGNFSTGGISQTSAFTPLGASQWCGGSSAACNTINLNSYLGNTGTLIKFESINGNGNNLYLDNINISGTSSVAPTAMFVSDTNICENGVIQFTDISQNMPSAWQWTFTGGSPSTSSAQNPLITYPSSGVYPVKLKAINSAGSDSVTQSGYVIVDAAKTVSVSITVNSNTVCDSDSLTFTATGINEGAFPTYQWKINGVNAGPSSNIFKTNSLNNGDSVWVEMTTSLDCVSNTTAVSNNEKIVVLPLPQVSLNGASAYCFKDSPSTLTGGSPSGGVYSGNGVTNGVFDPAAAGNGSTWIYYTYTDGTGCSNTAQKSVYVFSASVTPTIKAVVTNTLSCNQNYPVYQWLDGSKAPIAGATSKNYSLTSNGDYYVAIQDGNGCFDTSAVVSINNIGIAESLENSLKIYPNPTSTHFNVELNLSTEENGSAILYNTLGEELTTISFETKSGVNSYAIDVSNYSTGVYLLEIRIGDKSILKRVSKL